MGGKWNSLERRRGRERLPGQLRRLSSGQPDRQLSLRVKWEEGGRRKTVVRGGLDLLGRRSAKSLST